MTSGEGLIGAKTASEPMNVTTVATIIAARIGRRGGGMGGLIDFIPLDGARP
jgi:hypothetical protein